MSSVARGRSILVTQPWKVIVMTDLAQVGAPATRALQGAGYDSLESLAGANTKELLALHGFGPTCRAIIDEALAEAGLEPLEEG